MTRGRTPLLLAPQAHSRWSHRVGPPANLLDARRAVVPVKDDEAAQGLKLVLARNYNQGAGSPGALSTPSCSAARCHGLGRGAGAIGGGAVSRMNRSSAATTAAASSAEARRRDDRQLRSAVHRSHRAYRARPCPSSPVLDHDAVLSAVSPARGDRARARGPASLPRRRVGDAGQGLPAKPAVRRLPRDAGPGRRTSRC